MTELITGIDLVVEQLRVARGEPLSFSQKDVVLVGHAIECRINAEHPWTFTPAPGTVKQWIAPGGPGVRVDTHLYSGYCIPPHYDSLIAKLLTHGPSRNEAVSRMRAALDEVLIEGVDSTVPLHRRLMDDAAFMEGGFNIHHLEHLFEQGFGPQEELSA
ncbi:Biotin carboxylase [compost metagenome]